VGIARLCSGRERLGDIELLPLEAELMSVAKYRNRLLLALSKADRALLTPWLEPVELDLRRPIERANKPISHAYFPDHGIISVVAKSADDQIEAGLIGREGMSGAAIVLGNHRSPNDAYVQMAGSAHRIPAKHLRAAMDTSKSLRQRLQRFAHVFMVQIAQTAFANGKTTIDARLARWLLMVHDRQDGNELALTHEFIAVMLGVRRSGVTDALHDLEGKRLIRASRGAIRILSRKGLIALAGGIYGVPEAEYERLMS
jgi:CRP-like cAMP-binding protein